MSDRLPRITPPAERALVGWITVSRILREYRHPQQLGPTFTRTLAGLESWVAQRCALQVVKTDDKASARDFLRVLAQQFRLEGTSMLDGADAPTKEAFNELATTVDQSVTEFCSATDHQLVELYRWAVEATERCYQMAGVTDASERLAEVDSVVRHSGMPPGAGPPRLPPPEGSFEPWLVAGDARFPEGGGPVEEVQLCIGGPDWATWGATPYVLLHEVLNHAMQGPWSEGCRAPKETDPFAEGWMDVVVYELQSLLVGGLYGEVPRLPEATEHMAESGGLYRARRNSEASSLRRSGMEAAERFHLHLRARNPQTPAADDTFVRLSLQLNASSLPHVSRGRFVAGVKLALQHQVTPSSGDIDVDEWLSEYERTDDALAFAERAIDLLAKRAADSIF